MSQTHLQCYLTRNPDDVIILQQTSTLVAANAYSAAEDGI